MKERRKTAKLRRRYRVIILVGSVIAAGWTPATRAQVSNFAPASIKPEARVSVRELKIPSKAREEFEQDLRRLTKRDSAGSLQHFDAAVRVYPGYYEVHYHEGIALLQLRNNEEALRCFKKPSI